MHMCMLQTTRLDLLSRSRSMGSPGSVRVRARAACTVLLHSTVCKLSKLASAGKCLGTCFHVSIPPYPETGKLESGSMSQKGTPLKSPSKSLHRLRMQREKKKYCGEEVGKVHVG